ncbi:MAG: hypothetical protein Q8M39_05580 [Sulfuricurvum sp.]|nr:hypothetical protein [Sulfuricurvum sp.]
MISKKVVLSLLVSAVLSADQKPINETMIEMYADYGTDLAVKQIDKNSLSLFAPSVKTPTMGQAKYLMERMCVAYGGNLYTNIKDSFGDKKSIPAFKQESLDIMTPEQKNKYIQLDPKSDNGYLIGKQEYASLFSEQRIKKGVFSLLDVDNFMPANGYYNTTCKASGDKLIYTAKTPTENGYFDSHRLDVTFGEYANTTFAKKTSTQSIDDVVSKFVHDKKEGKILLRPSIESYLKIVTDFCDSSSGKLFIDGNEQVRAGSSSSFSKSMACTNINEPFYLTKYNIFYLLTKGAMPSSVSAHKSISNDNLDVRKNFAASVGDMPTGSTSETNIGNMKLVSTVYKNDGSSKLINITEVGGNSAFKNYRVANGEAVDITDRNWAFANLKLPQKLIDAKQKLVAQCTVYGASRLMIDNYSASCEKQSLGSGCVANMIYTRGDQFAGKESFDCAK